MNGLASIAILASEDPSQSQHPIFPGRAELIYGTLASLVVFFLLWKFAWPLLKKMFADRSARIQKEIDDAATARAEADAAATEIRAAKGDIESERARILADADQQAARLLEEGRARLDLEVVELGAKADADVATSRSRVVSELEGEVAQVAAAATEKVVVEALGDAAQIELVEQYIATVGATR